MKQIFFLALYMTSMTSFGQMLPRWLTEDEKIQMPAYLSSFDINKKATIAPSNARSMAEWEEVEYLVLTWAGYTSILRNIVRYGREEAKVIVVCSDSNNVKNYLQAGGVSLSNVEYLQTGFNSIWMRDYFGNSAYVNGVDSLVMVDWVYNRPRPLDDIVAHKIAIRLNINLYETAANPERLIHTGGNFMSDGIKAGFSSNLVLDENTDKTKAEVDAIMKDYLGIDPYINMTVLPYDGIHHIDMHMKLMNENTLLFSEYPSGISDGPQIEANIDYILNNFKTSDGENFNIERIDMPTPPNGKWPNQGGNYYTYANMLFINNTILVPIYNISEDQVALDRIKEMMPGYKIQGIDCSSIIPLGGAIHCITHTIGVQDPLLINHFPIANQEDNGNDYQITALASHRTGINNVKMYWTTDTAAVFNLVNMTPTSNPLDEWKATIPNQNYGATVYYYFDATAVSGKNLTRPMSAPKGYFSFDVIGVTGLDQFSNQNLINRVYPNPAKAITAVDFNATEGEVFTISLITIEGRFVSEQIYTATNSGINKWFFDASNLSDGLYLIKISYQKATQSKLLIINK